MQGVRAKLRLNILRLGYFDGALNSILYKFGALDENACWKPYVKKGADASNLAVEAP